MSANSRHCNCIYTYDREKALELMKTISKSCDVKSKLQESKYFAQLIFEDGLSFVWIRPDCEAKGNRFHFVYMDRNITIEEKSKVEVLADLYWNENFEWI